jgi:hypothetical protein
MPESSVHDLLRQQGYRLVEDAWEGHGRVTYLHDDSADRSFLIGLAQILRSAGWTRDKSKLRTFRNELSKEAIEIEPGGSETSGHFLHHTQSD